MSEYTTRPISPYFKGDVPPLIDPVADLIKAVAAKRAARAAMYGKKRTSTINFRRLEKDKERKENIWLPRRPLIPPLVPPLPSSPHRRFLSSNTINSSNTTMTNTTMTNTTVPMCGNCQCSRILPKPNLPPGFDKWCANPINVGDINYCLCPKITTTTTTAKPATKKKRITKFYDLQNYTTLTDIWNVTMNSTEVESDQPSTVSVRTLLYKFTPFNPPKCSLSESVGFTNCTMDMILHPSFGPWTPKRENYTNIGYFNPHYYNSKDVCLHMKSSNTDLVWPKDTRSVGLDPAGHELIITPRPWRYGSTTITVTATAFNRTLGELLYQKKIDINIKIMNQQRENAIDTYIGNVKKRNNDTTSWSTTKRNEYAQHLYPSYGTNTTTTNITSTQKSIDPCELYHLIVDAEKIGNHQTYVLARKSFSLRVNQTICYGFVDLFPGMKYCCCCCCCCF